MKKRLAILIAFLCSLGALAQQKASSSPVSILIGDSIYAISPVTTQTEVKPGWKIVDIQTKSHTKRYLWGSQSRQMVETAKPTFIIDPGQSQLIDYAIIRLKKKREYRLLPKAELKECDYHTFDLNFATVRVRTDDRFEVTPNEPLQEGEYIVVLLTQDAVNEYGDLIVYPFTIERQD